MSLTFLSSHSCKLRSILPCKLYHMIKHLCKTQEFMINVKSEENVQNTRKPEYYIYIHKSPCSSLYTYWHSRRCDMFHSHDLRKNLNSSEVVHLCTRSCFLSMNSNSYFFLDCYICSSAHFIYLLQHHLYHVFISKFRKINGIW